MPAKNKTFTYKLKPTKEQLVEFGAVVRKRRIELKMTMAGFGEKVSLSTSAVNNIEQGHNYASLMAYFKICDALSMPRPAFAPLREELP